jgi:hypothetical protein
MADRLTQRSSSKRGRLKYALLVALLVIVVIVGLLPAIVSMGPLRRMVVSAIDRTIDGDLGIESWKLTWFRGVTVSGVSYKSQQLDAAVESVKMSSGILQLLPGQVDAGELVITRPEIRYFQPVLKHDVRKTPEGTPPRPPRKGREPQADPSPRRFGVDVVGHLVVLDGSLEILNAQDNNRIAAFDYEADVKCEGLGSPVKIDVRAGQSRAGSAGRDALHLSGSIQLLQDGVFLPSRVTGDLRLAADDLDLAVLAPVATLVPQFPRTSGRLDGMLHLLLHDTRSAKGELVATDLGLEGGALGKDRLEITRVSANIDATAVQGGLRVEQFHVTSPLFNINAHGNFKPVAGSDYPDGDLKLDAEVNVASLAGQLRSTLKLREGLEFSSGTLRLISSVTSKPEKVDGRLAGAVSDLGGRIEGEPFVLAEPIEFEVAGYTGTAGPGVDNLMLHSSFADISGRGTLSNARLHVEANLGQAMQEVGHLFSLDIGLTGNLLADATIRQTDGAGRHLSFNGGIDSFSLEGLSRREKLEKVPDIKGAIDAEVEVQFAGNQPVAVKGAVDARAIQFSGGLFGKDQPVLDKADVDVNLALTNDVVEIRSLVFRSSMGDIRVAGRVTPPKGGEIPEGSIDMNAKLNLAELAGQLPELFGLGEEVVISRGTLQVEGRVDSRPQQLGFNVDGSLFDFESIRNGKTIDFDEPLHIELDGAFNGNQLTLSQGTLRGGFGRIDAKGDLEAAVVSADLDVSRTIKTLRPFIKDRDVDGRGSIKGSAKLRRSGAGAYRLSIDLSMEALSVSGITPKPWAPRDIKLSADSELLFTTNKQFIGVQDTDLKIEGLPGDLRLSNGELLFGKAGVRKGKIELNLRGDAAELVAFGRETGVFKGNTPISGSYGIELKSTFEEGDLRIEKLALLSDALGISCAGDVREIKTGRLLDVNGQLDVDFKKVSHLCDAFTGHRPDIEGISRREFSLALPLGEADWRARLRGATGHAQLSADRYKAFGIEAAPVNLDFVMKGGRARVSLDSEVSQGRLSVAPYIDSTVKPPILGVATNSKVLQDVKISDEMASELFALIHPIFRGCTILGGDTDLTLAECRVPMRGDIAKNTKLAGRLRFENLRMGPAGLLDKILTLTKNKIEAVDVPDQNIDFYCKDGRIHSTPLKITARGYRLILRGSVGFDQTVDYVAEIPVTKKMVGSDIYPYVKNTSIKLHIGGTVSSPDLGKDAFARALQDLIREAGADALKNTAIKEGRKLLENFLKK